ncbi:hypothetical protein D3C72_2063860 [compost metagenome]
MSELNEQKQLGHDLSPLRQDRGAFGMSSHGLGHNFLCLDRVPLAKTAEGSKAVARGVSFKATNLAATAGKERQPTRLYQSRRHAEVADFQRRSVAPAGESAA